MRTDQRRPQSPGAALVLGLVKPMPAPPGKVKVYEYHLSHLKSMHGRPHRHYRTVSVRFRRFDSHGQGRTVLGGVTGLGRGNPVTAESAHNVGAISAPPHISPPEAGTVALFRGVFETWRTSWRTTRFHFGAGAWLLSILRPLRVLAYRESHLKLLALPVYKQFGATMLREHPFHHISHHHYLRQGLTVRQRVQYVYQHYAFESHMVD